MLRATAIALAVGLSLALPAAAADAAPGVYQQVLQTYERSGSIPPCRFTAADLQRALGGVDAYGAEYFADFTQAVQAALTARAAGACTPAASVARLPAAAADVAPPPSPGSLTAGGDAAAPLPLIMLAALAVLSGLLAAGAGVVRARGRRERGG